MLQTLFYIPNFVYGIPVFGFGLLLVVWAIGSAALLTYLVRVQGWNNDTRGYVPVLGLIGVAIAFLIPAIAEERGLPIRGYGTMVLLGVAGGIWLAAVRAKRAGLDPELIFSLAFWMFLAGIFGARLFYVIEYWEPQFHKATLGESIGAVANIAQGGLVVFGAFIFGSAAFIWFALKHRLPVLASFDLIAPSMLLGLALGRIGCFLNGCCFGGQCELPWKAYFPFGSPPHVRQVEDGKLDLFGLFIGDRRGSDPVILTVTKDSQAERAGLTPGMTISAVGVQSPQDDKPKLTEPVHTKHEAQLALLKADQSGTTVIVKVQVNGSHQTKTWTTPDPLPRSGPVHPTQIYSAIDAAILCLFLLAWYPYRQRDGELLAWMLVLHGISRMLLEWIRKDEPKEFLFGMTISQNISLGLLAVGIGLWIYLLRQPRELNFYGAAGN